MKTAMNILGVISFVIVTFVAMIFSASICGCYDVDDSQYETEATTDNNESDSDTESAQPDRCTLDDIGYKANECVCNDNPTSEDHYGCCEYSDQFGWGWKWYVCPSDSYKQGICLYNEDDNVYCSYK